MRVTTESTQIDKKSEQQLKISFLKEFSQWLTKPLVFKALGSSLKELFPDWNFADDSTANRNEVAEMLIEILDDTIQMSIEGGNLNYVFMNDIIGAIKYVGKEKILVSNISLGTNFSDTPTDMTFKKPEEQAKAMYDFLSMEYFKYQLGDTIKKHAPGTLFIVAAGNESTWVDGETRSALPMDLSSPWLKDHEKQGLSAPNNSITNILAVGSLGKKERFSCFTNIPINTDNLVFALGENVLSPISTQDMTGMKQIFSGYLDGFTYNLMDLSPAGDRFYHLYKELGMTKESDTPEDAISKAETNFFAYSMFFEDLSAAMQMQLYHKFPVVRAKLSGTSMASPIATRIATRNLLKKILQAGFTEHQVYMREGFLPKDTKKMLLDLTTGYRGDPESRYRVLTEVSLFEYGEDGKDLLEFLDAAETKAKSSPPSENTQVELNSAVRACLASASRF